MGEKGAGRITQLSMSKKKTGRVSSAVLVLLVPLERRVVAVVVAAIFMVLLWAPGERGGEVS